MKKSICVFGCGYVGLPLLVALDKENNVFGFDTNKKRIEQLRENIDATKEVDSDCLKKSEIKFISNTDEIKHCSVFIITVPTPITLNLEPDYNFLRKASLDIGKILKKDDLVIFESTVDPKATYRECLPILEATSGLKLNEDFGIGYSPERTVPGQTNRKLKNTVKVFAGSNDQYAQKVKEIYSSIPNLKLHKASSIEIAEASKIIENIQRDVNIALMNELEKVFFDMGINFKEALDASMTKWNFAPFFPGLVGGHCISIDPYYLINQMSPAHKKNSIINKARNFNEQYVKDLGKRFKRSVKDSKNKKILYLGVTFKPDCPDFRNSKAITFIKQTSIYFKSFDIFDPFADKEMLFKEEHIILLSKQWTDIDFNEYDLICVVVNHKLFQNITTTIPIQRLF